MVERAGEFTRFLRICLIDLFLARTCFLETSFNYELRSLFSLLSHYQFSSQGLLIRVQANDPLRETP